MAYLWLVISEGVEAHFDLSLITEVTSNCVLNGVGPGAQSLPPLHPGNLSVKVDPHVSRLLKLLLPMRCKRGGLGNALTSGIEAKNELEKYGIKICRMKRYSGLLTRRMLGSAKTHSRIAAIPVPKNKESGPQSPT